MRKQVVRIITSVSLFVLLGCACAEAQTSNNRLQAHIPFAFQIGQQTLPAGDYVISFINRDSNLRTLQLQTSDGHTVKMVQLTPVQAREMPAQGQLIFNRYGAQYFLAQVFTPADRYGLELSRSKSERELARNTKLEHESVRLMASK